MKKFLGVLCSMLMCAMVWANINVQGTAQKINNLQLIEEKALQFDEFDQMDPAWAELTTLAKETYEKNPLSFNAAYNYGVIIYSAYGPGTGTITDDKTLKKALNVFEQAEKILPNKTMLLERKYHVLSLLLLGNGVPFFDMFNDELLDVFSRNPIHAEKMFNTIDRLFSLKKIGLDKKVPQAYEKMALYAFLIKLAQKDYTGAEKWLPALGGEKQLKTIWMYERSTNDFQRKKEIENWEQIAGNYAKALKQVGISVSAWKQEGLTAEAAKVQRQIAKDMAVTESAAWKALSAVPYK